MNKNKSVLSILAIKLCLVSSFIPSKKTFSQTDTSSLSTSKTVLLPLITKSIETDWSFGLATIFTFKMNKKDTISRTSNIGVIALYSLKKQFVAVINGNQYFKNEKLILNEQLSYSSFPDKFWGIGRSTNASAEEPYSFNQYYLFAHLMKNLGNRFFVGAIVEHQNVFNLTYNNGGLFDKENVAGKNGYFTTGIGVSLTKDSRNNAFAPDNGLFAQLFFTNYSKALGSSYNFSTLVIDVRKYIPIATNHVLALQVYSLNNIGKSIPLRNLGALGGANSMRGFYNGRYRDNNLMVFQSEYRLPVYKGIGIAGFGSIGNVGNSLADFHLNDIKYSYGAGIRVALNKKEKLNLRIDYGFGKGGNNGLYFQIGEAF